MINFQSHKKKEFPNIKKKEFTQNPEKKNFLIKKKNFLIKKKNFQIKKEKENNFLLSQSQTLDPSLSGATFRLFLERKTLLQAVLK